MSQVSSTRVHQIYDDFANARLEGLSEALDEHVDFVSHAPADIFPYLGRRRGRTDVIEAFSEIYKKFEVLSFWPITVLVDGNDAAVTLFVDLKERNTGKRANFLAAHFLRFRNGRIAEYRSIVDSWDAMRQLRPPAQGVE